MQLKHGTMQAKNLALPCGIRCNNNPLAATYQAVNQVDKSLREQRFNSIVDDNHNRFGRIARVYAGNDAEDLVQEILMQVWRSLPDYDLRAKLSTWCYRIALNTAISWRRTATRAKRRPPENRVASDSLPSQTNFSNEAELLDRFLDSLSEVDRAVLLMYLDDLTNKEIAESIGVSNGAIRTRISRIRDQLETWEAKDGES